MTKITQKFGLTYFNAKNKFRLFKKYLLRNSFFRLETCNFTKTKPLQKLYRNNCKM